MRPTQAGQPHATPRQSRPSHAEGATRPDYASEPPGASRPGYPSQPPGVSRPGYPSQPPGAARPGYAGDARSGQTEEITRANYAAGTRPGQTDEAAQTGRIRPGQTAAHAGYPTDARPGPADGVYQPGHAGPPAEDATRTGRAGPVGWRPPTSPPPGAAAMRTVPHPEVVRQRPIQDDDRLLPVPVERPKRRTSWQPLALIAVRVAGILVAVGVVVATLPRGDNGAAPGPAASSTLASSPPSATATASPVGGAPENVKLRDNRDSVSLTWSYPKNSEGPVLISGGRAGQEQRAFQQLPAGTTDYVVYGLNNSQDYCFTVAVVYTVDRVAASKPLCTKRK